MNLKVYFKYLPGAADDIYDNVFVSYHENKQLLLDRKENDKCFRCFSGVMFIPYKLLVISLFLFPFFCLFGTIAGRLQVINYFLKFLFFSITSLFL